MKTFDLRNEELRGRVGMVVLIFGESAFFAIFVAAYIFYIGKSLTGPFPQDVLEIPVLGTICLLSSSITIVAAVRALRAGNRRAFLLWWVVTMLLGVEFLVGTAAEWYGLIYDNGLTLQKNLFGSTFYALVGLHATHVIVGVIAIGLVLALGLRGHVTPRHAEHVEVLSWYWHFVDSVWVVVLLTVYVIGR